MEIDLPYYAVVILFSCIGFVYFAYGKKMGLFWFMLSGLTLMFYGYFCDTWGIALGLGCLFSLAPFGARYL